MEQQTNPFFSIYNTPHQTIPFHQIKTAHYEPAIRKGIEDAKKEIDQITHNPEKPTFNNTIKALNRAGELLNRVCDTFFPLLHAESNEDMIELSQKITPLLSQYANDITLNDSLFKRIKSVYRQRKSLNLDEEDLMLLEKTYQNFIRKGANLSSAEKETFRQLSTELSTVSLTFGQNILQESNLYELHLTQKEDLEGLPESCIRAAAQEAAEKGKEGWLFTLSMPSYFPFMKYARNRSLREKLYRAYTSRCGHGGEYDNRTNIKKIVNLRRILANLLGYETYASYSTKETMAGSKREVYSLLNKLYKAYYPVAKKEVERIEQYARECEGDDFELQAWDWPYYSEQLKDKTYQINDELLRPYFELSRVQEGVLGLATRLYGITFHKNQSIPVYHPDVVAYEVHDQDNSLLAILYMDFFPRQGKSNGAWMTNFREESIENGKRIIPFVNIVMNFTKPTADTPSLLTLDEVRTFMHEFGHSLHSIFANTHYATLSGTNVYRDFVELPSQLMENWSIEQEYLNSFARHYQTGETIPETYIQKIKEAACYHVGYACIRQLTFAYLDMAWHTLAQQFDDDVEAFEQEVLEKTVLLPAVTGSSISPAFSHIFSGGYAAGYYSYKWSEVLDADIYSVFQQKGIFNTDTALHFRQCILEKGGTVHPMTLYKTFKGEKPAIEALLRRNRIID